MIGSRRTTVTVAAVSLAAAVLAAPAVASTGASTAATVPTTAAAGAAATGLARGDLPKAKGDLPKGKGDLPKKLVLGHWNFGLVGVESDGPYPGATQIHSGGSSNSTAMWKADGGATLQTSWVRCARGKVALGGGFSTNTGDVAYKKIQIVASYPAALTADGKDDPSGVIKGDPDGSIRPNAWVVEGYNSNPATANLPPGQVDPATLIVRPHVVCAYARG